MPAKNTVKLFAENSYYHVYNRGVEKRNIFLDDQDYAVFLSYLKEYLDPNTAYRKSLTSDIDLIAFCLMPNHFHLLVKQTTRDGVTKLLRAVCTRYVMYFNLKYNRVGGLFQGIYKAALISNDQYLLHLSRYIHLNPFPGFNPESYSYSSYPYYLGLKKASWVKPQEVLSSFRSAQKLSFKDHSSYQSFIEDAKIDSEQFLASLTLQA